MKGATELKRIANLVVQCAREAIPKPIDTREYIMIMQRVVSELQADIAYVEKALAED